MTQETVLREVVDELLRDAVVTLNRRRVGLYTLHSAVCGGWTLTRRPSEGVSLRRVNVSVTVNRGRTTMKLQGRSVVWWTEYNVASDEVGSRLAVTLARNTCFNSRVKRWMDT